MAYVPLNVMLQEPLKPGSKLALAYPEGASEGSFFCAVHHTLSIDAAFYRSPRDFVLNFTHDGMVLTWVSSAVIPPGKILNLQIDEPAGDNFRDLRLNITVQRLIAANLFLVNFGQPDAAEAEYFVGATVLSNAPLVLRTPVLRTPRCVTIETTDDTNAAIFVVRGRDMYERKLMEHVPGPKAGGMAVTKRAFAYVDAIHAEGPVSGDVRAGTSRNLGFPVYVAGGGYVLRAIAQGEEFTGYKVTPAENAYPTPSTGDRRGIFTPPDSVLLDGKTTLHVLVALANPSHIGLPDYAG